MKRAPNEGLFTCLPQKMRSSILLRHQINCGPRHSESSICQLPVCRLRDVVYRELWLMVHRRQRLDVLFIGWVLGRHADHERGNVQFDARATASSTDNPLTCWAGSSRTSARGQPSRILALSLLKSPFLLRPLMLRPTMDTLLGDYVGAPVPPPEPANMGAFARRAPT
jgi:hypothetical protein